MKDKIIESLSIALIIGFVGFLADMAFRLKAAEGNIVNNKVNVEDKVNQLSIDMKEVKGDIKELLKRY